MDSFELIGFTNVSFKNLKKNRSEINELEINPTKEDISKKAYLILEIIKNNSTKFDLNENDEEEVKKKEINVGNSEEFDKSYIFLFK